MKLGLFGTRRIEWFSVRGARYGLRGVCVGEASHPGPPVPRSGLHTIHRHSADATVESEAASENQPGVGSDENERFANMLDALEHDLPQSPVPTVIGTSGEVRNAHRE